MIHRWTRWLLPAVWLLALAPVWPATMAERLRQYGPAARARLRPAFDACGVAYPPPSLTLAAFKDERTLELYAPDRDSTMRFVRAYPILAASGGPGPKLREGDLQVPEGIYRIDFLNPNSRYHLSLHVNYPNAYDRAQARREGRTRLGGDIMIHGNAVSAGCLAMGDEAAEDLFVLAADTALPRLTLIISPVDFRRTDFTLDSPAWAEELYAQIRAALQPLPAPPVPHPTVPPAGTATPAAPGPWLLLTLIAALLAAVFALTLATARRRLRAERRRRLG